MSADAIGKKTSTHAGTTTHQEDGIQPTLVAISGYADDNHIQLSASAGFDHYLSKPADLDALKPILAETCVKLGISDPPIRSGIPAIQREGG